MTKTTDEKTVFIEPGEEFQVEYGNGKRATVVCLAGSTKRKLGETLSKILKAEASGDPIKCLDNAGLAYDSLKIVMPNATEEFLETIDEQFAMQILFNCYGKQAVGDEDKKKSDSPL